MAPTPGIEPGPTGWQLETIPQRHSDIYLKWPELKLFNRLHLFLKSKNKNQAQFRNNLDVQVTGAVTKTSNNNANIPKGISVTPSGSNNSTKIQVQNILQSEDSEEPIYAMRQCRESNPDLPGDSSRRSHDATVTYTYKGTNYIYLYQIGVTCGVTTKN